MICQLQPAVSKPIEVAAAGGVLSVGDGHQEHCQCDGDGESDGRDQRRIVEDHIEGVSEQKMTDTPREKTYGMPSDQAAGLGGYEVGHGKNNEGTRSECSHNHNLRYFFHKEQDYEESYQSHQALNDVRTGILLELRIKNFHITFSVEGGSDLKNLAG
jgi:hypothetical protein